MILRNTLCFTVYLCMCFRVGYTQFEDFTISGPVNESITTTTLATPSEVVCSICDCAKGLVDCAGKNITEPFNLWDWEALTSLEPTKVDLSNNNLGTVTRFARLDIQYLNRSICNIDKLEDASFQYLANLTSLDLSHNNIATDGLNKKKFVGQLFPGIPPVEFYKLRYLSLAYNDIHSLPQDLFMSTPRITQLDLSGNPLAYIDQVTMGAITDLVSLEELKLASCELESLPEGLLRRQRRLKRLDLSDNRFKTLPSVLQEAINLVYLKFDRNSLTTLDSQTAELKLPNLQELSLSRLSKLQNITQSALGGLQNLVTLRLSYNPRLTNIDPYFLMSKDEDGEEQWPLIKELHLNNNNISSVDSHMLDSWSSLTTIDVSHNPFTCDCTNQWMVDVLLPLIQNSASNASIEDMVCKKPADVRGLTFAQLQGTSRTLACPETESLTELPTSNMAIILGVMIGIMVTFPLVLVVVLLWRKGYFAKCRSRKLDDDDYYRREAEYL